MRYTDNRAVSFDDLARLIEQDYILNRRKTQKRLKQLIAHLQPFFGGIQPRNITTEEVKAYAEQRIQEGAANGTINRELAVLKRMFILAYRETPPKIQRIPYIPMLKENNIRSGFYEYQDYKALMNYLPLYAQVPVSIAYFTGMRSGEIFKLEWSQINLKHKYLILPASNTKTGKARLLLLPADLYACLVQWHWETNTTYPECQWVCHRKGKRLKTIRHPFETAVKKAGLDGSLFHDFRRAALRNYVRAGTPRQVAKAITGHRTDSAFNRYDIVDDRDLENAVRNLERYLEKEKSA